MPPCAVIEELSRDHHRARRLVLAAGGMVGGAAIIVGVLHALTSQGTSQKQEINVAPSSSLPSPAACGDLRLEVKEIWTDARKKDVAKAFKDATRYWARDQSDRVERVLDAWSDAWIEARRAACRIDDKSARRVACLDDRLRMLDAMVTELGRADPTTLQHAMTAVEHLPPPQTCNDDDSLARRPAPPASEAQSKIALVDKELATTWAMLELGHGREARPTAERLEKDAKSIGYEPTSARASWLAGNTALEDGDGKLAVERMTTAATLAQGSKDGDLLLAIAADLVVIEGAILDHGDEAARWAKLGEGEAKREGSDTHTVWSLWSAVGAWHLREGKPLEAREAFKKAVAVGETRLGKTHGDTASSLSDLATALLALDEREEAEKLARRALKIVQDRFGDEHPLAGAYRKIVADALFQDGQTEKAVAEYRRTMKVRTDALHMYDADYSASIEDLGRALAALGKLDEAAKEHERALGLRQHVMAPDHPDVALSFASLGDLRILQGKTEDGLAKHREAIAYLEKLVEPDEPRLADARVSLADALVRVGKADASIAPYQAAITQLTKRFGERSSRVALVRWKLGLALGKKGDPTKGLAQLDDISLDIDATYGFEHRRTAALTADRAKLTLATGDRKRAAELYGVALTRLTESLGKDDPETVAVRKALAEASKN